jgi:DNA-binding protein HU-beta
LSGRVFEARIARGIAPDDRAREERLKAVARALVTAVRDGLVRDGMVRLHGFGTFRLRPVAARRGRHPRTGEPIEIPAGWRVVFRPAKALRERVEPERAPSLPVGEPQASREAMLASAAAPQATQPDAGRIPGGAPATQDQREPPRAAAVAMPEAKLSAHGPIPPARVDLEADTRVTRSPAALTRRPSPAADEAPSAASTSRRAPANVTAVQPPPAPTPEAGAPRLHSRSPTAALILLLALIAGLAWLLRPGDPPEPRVAGEPAGRSAVETPGASLGGSGDTGAAGSTGFAGSENDVADPAPSGDTAGPEPEPEPERASAGQIEVADAVATGADASGAKGTGGETAAGSAGAGGADARATDATETDATETDTDARTAGTDINPTGTAAARLPAPDVIAATDARALSALSGAGGSSSPEIATPENAAREQAITEQATTEQATTEKATTQPAGSGGSPAPYFDGRAYTVRRGDTLWDLADRNYINPYYWPHIWNHNGDIANPDRLEVRQGVWLPTLEGDPRSLTEADRRSIAEGYLRLYRFFRAQGDANPQYALVGVRYFDVSVLPERLRDTAAGRPGDTLAAAFQARLEAEFPLE